MKKILVLLIFNCFISLNFAQTNVILKINHQLDQDQFTFNTSYTNDLGDYFSVDRLQYYISSISIIHDGGVTTNISNTWILVNAGTSVYESLGDYNINNVEAISFGIGVESAVNHLDPTSYNIRHPLAPKSPSMHWGWTAGYRFVAMEGNAGATSSTLNQIYELHGLDDSNYMVQTIPTSGMMNGNDLVVELNADYTKALNGINVASGVTSHGATGEARAILNNFRDHVFTAVHPVSIEENGKIEFKIFPNPTQKDSKFTLSGNIAKLIGKTLVISDIKGKLVKEIVVSNVQISTDNLEAGLYFITLEEQGNSITQKLLITQ